MKTTVAIAALLLSVGASHADENNLDLFGMPLEQRSGDYTSQSRVGNTTVTTGTANGSRFDLTTNHFEDGRSVTSGTVDGKYFTRTCRGYGTNTQTCD